MTGFSLSLASCNTYLDRRTTNAVLLVNAQSYVYASDPWYTWVKGTVGAPINM